MQRRVSVITVAVLAASILWWRFPLAASPTTSYYVDPAGNDSLDGKTPATAWRTIAKVNAAKLTPGDWVGFKRGGTWSGTQLNPQHGGSLKKPIVFGTYVTGTNPIITMGTNHTISISQDYLTFDDLDIRNTSSTYSAVYFSNIASGTVIERCTVSSVNYGMISGNTLTGLTVTNLTVNASQGYLIKLYGSGNSNITISGVTASSSATTSGTVEIDNAANVTLTNLNLAGTGPRGPDYLLYLRALSGNIVLSNITLANAARYNLVLDSCTGLLKADNIVSTGSADVSLYDESLLASGSSLSNSTLSSSGGDGFRCDGCTNLALNNVVSQNNGEYGFNFMGPWSAITATDSRAINNAYDGWAFQGSGSNFVGLRLLAQANHIDGFSMEDGSTAHDVECDYCQALGNGGKKNVYDGDGFTAHDFTYHFILKYCIAAGNTQSGLAFIAASQGSVYNCTLYNNGGQWSTQGGGQVDSQRGNIYFSITGLNPITGTGWTVLNTVSSGGWPQELKLSTVNYTTLNYNLYYHPADSNVALIVDAGSTPISWTTYHVTDGYEPNSIYGDPLFTSPATGDFTLKAGSPAIGTGLYIPGVSTANPPNIGAE